MGAFVDRSVHCIIKLDGQTPIAGAYPIGRPYFCAPKKSLLISQVGMKKQVSRGYPEGIKTWLICNHLDTPEKFISSYIKHHYFVVFDSHVFCHDCNEENMRDGEPAFLRMELAATALTDDPAVIEPRKDTEFSIFSGEITGRNLAVEPPGMIEQEWYFGEQPAASIVRLELDEKAGKTEIRLQHSNIPDDAYDNISAGWREYYLGALKSYIEN